MIPLNAYLVDTAALLAGLTYDEAMERVKSGIGFRYTLNGAEYMVRDFEGVPVLEVMEQERVPVLDQRYQVLIDSVIADSFPRLFQACWLAEKLCYPLSGIAREIAVFDNVEKTTRAQWVENSRHQFGSWVNMAKV